MTSLSKQKICFDISPFRGDKAMVAPDGALYCKIVVAGIKECKMQNAKCKIVVAGKLLPTNDFSPAKGVGMRWGVCRL